MQSCAQAIHTPRPSVHNRFISCICLCCSEWSRRDSLLIVAALLEVLRRRTPLTPSPSSPPAIDGGGGGGEASGGGGGVGGGGRGGVGEARAGARRRRKRYGLVEYRALPGYLRDNEYIHRHYRCEWPLPQVLLSAFSIHNETLNVWTHLIGFFIFLSLTIYTATQVPNVVGIQSLQHLPDVRRNADIHKIQAELLSCLPSLPHLSDLQKLKDELKSSWNSMEVLPSLPVGISWSYSQIACHTDLPIPMKQVCLLFKA
ncbi:unnamed protein product [Urochloa humidicola]